MSYEQKDIDELLERWNDAKEELSILEKKIENYKKYAERVMNRNDLDSISSIEYELIKREMKRSVLSKDDVPSEIWNKYSRSIQYPMYILKRRKKEK